MVTPMLGLPLYGTNGDDDIAGTDDADLFFLNDGGTDLAHGGAGDDVFYYGMTFDADDRVDGGSGNDILVLQGTYSSPMELTGVILAGVETIVMLTGTDTRFGASGAGTYSYNFTTDDTLLAAGEQLTVQGNKLGAAEPLTFMGYNEFDGHFRLIGGAADDVLFGGAGADMLCGGLGRDFMSGMDGDDMYVYRSVAESTVAAPDRILSTNIGDLFDLSAIDADTGTAGEQAFTFIGSDGFHNVAGELRAFGDSGSWTIQADINGDGVADFAITGQLGDPPLDAGFFLL